LKNFCCHYIFKNGHITIRTFVLSSLYNVSIKKKGLYNVSASCKSPCSSFQDEGPNDRKIGKLCEYISRNPMRVPKVYFFLCLACIVLSVT
jgi:hypothetical protein